MFTSVLGKTIVYFETLEVVIYCVLYSSTLFNVFCSLMDVEKERTDVTDYCNYLYVR